MIAGFLALILYNGVATFWPRPIQVVKLADGKLVAGNCPDRSSSVLRPNRLRLWMKTNSRKLPTKGLSSKRNLYKIGNFDLYNEDYKWVPEYEILESSTPPGMYYVERMEWGPFVGAVKSVQLNGKNIDYKDLDKQRLAAELKDATGRRNRISDIERNDIAKINTMLDAERLRLRKVGLKSGKDSPEYKKAQERFTSETEKLDANYQELSKEAAIVKDRDAQYTITLADVTGREKTIKLSQIVRMYAANSLTSIEKIGIYLSRWWEFLTRSLVKQIPKAGLCLDIRHILYDCAYGAGCCAFRSYLCAVSPGIRQARATCVPGAHLCKQPRGCAFHSLWSIRFGILRCTCSEGA